MPDDLEELLRLVKTQDKQPSSNLKDEISRFLLFYKIEPGNKRVLPTLLYKLYNEWSNDPCKSREFALKLSNYLPRISNGLVLVNQDSFELIEKFNIIIGSRVKLQNKTKIPHIKKHFESFLKINDLIKGSNWVNSDLLYYFYKQWIYKNKGKKIGIIPFINMCKLYFPYKYIDKKQRYYFGVDDIFVKKLTPQKLSAIERSLNDSKRKTKEKI